MSFRIHCTTPLRPRPSSHTLHSSSAPFSRHGPPDSPHLRYVFRIGSPVASNLSVQPSTSITEALDTNSNKSAILACNKVLKKHPPSRDVDGKDSFSFNSEFTSPMQRIKISTISASTTKVENQEERKETRSRVDEERKVQIDVSLHSSKWGADKLIHYSRPVLCE